MPKNDEIDVAAERAKFMQDREAKIYAQTKKEQEDGSERDSVRSQFANPPSVRADDGLPPGEKPRNPLEIAAENDAEAENEDADEGNENDGVPTMANKADEIKAYLDTLGIKYDPAAKKADLLALIPA